MYRTALLLACFLWSGNGRRVQRADQQEPEKRREEQLGRQVGIDSSLQSLAKLLHASGSATAFQTAGVGHRQVLNSKDHLSKRAGLLSPGSSIMHRANVLMDEVTEDKTTASVADAAAETKEACEECSIDNLSACSQQELELLYVDALWEYYDKKKPLITDDQYSKLVQELNWQGSGFPSLRREEVKFVKAALAFAKGEPIVNDKKWEQMKADAKAAGGKRLEVTQFLLYARSLRETAETRKRLFEEMGNSGIEMEVTASGASCTLSDVPSDLKANVGDVLQMYLALTAIPTTLALLVWVIVALAIGGPEGIIDTAIPGIPIAGGVSALITTNLIKYVELAQPELLEGLCPCCECDLAYMSTSYNSRTPKITCGKCKTDIVFDCDKREIGKAGGLNIIGTEEGGEAKKGQWVDDILKKKIVLNTISDLTMGKPNDETKLGGPGKAEKKVIPDDMTVGRYVQENIGEGLFAFAVLAGYQIFGEQFVIRARGKLISLHSQAINSFATKFWIDAKQKKLWVETAKRNGEELGFLVKPPKLFGDGLIGKQALAWYKEQGF